MHINREKCDICGACVEVCPSAALELIGRQWSAEELMEELLKDEVFYETSGGGITFSGGEPMMQVDFLCEVLPRCQQNRLHVALDTCGAVSWGSFERVLPYVNLVLYDLKILDTNRHRSATGVGNELILENARRLAERRVPMWIRTPLIPGFTNDRENVSAIARFICDELPTVQRWDLLAYTNLGGPKYERLDRKYLLAHIPLLTRNEMESAWKTAVELVPVARWSGATRRLE
jgi:pyruvate formate lyase activating enzyme